MSTNFGNDSTRTYNTLFDTILASSTEHDALEHFYFKNKSGRQCFWPFWIFPGFLELYSKEIKTNAAADSALFKRLPEKENRFRDV